MKKLALLTLKASSLDNRRSERPAESGHSNLHSEGVPHLMLMGDPFRVDTDYIQLNSRGCSLRSYPRLLSGDAFSVFGRMKKG